MAKVSIVIRGKHRPLEDHLATERVREEKGALPILLVSPEEEFCEVQFTVFLRRSFMIVPYDESHQRARQTIAYLRKWFMKKNIPDVEIRDDFVRRGFESTTIVGEFTH